MNIILVIVGVIAALIAIVMIAALFVKKAYSLQRSIVINKAVPEVFDFIKYLRNTEQYSKWVMTDPQLRKQFRGSDGTVGAVYAWESDNKKVGKGEQEIISLSDNKKVGFEIRFIKPFEGKADAFMSTEPAAGNQTTVTWGFSSSMKYPMNIMLALFNMEGMLGKDLEISLKNLKVILDK